MTYDSDDLAELLRYAAVSGRTCAPELLAAAADQIQKKSSIDRAAPDMLAALKMVRETTYQMHDETLRTIEAAIAKAEL